MNLKYFEWVIKQLNVRMHDPSNEILHNSCGCEKKAPPKIQTCWDLNPDLCDKTAVQHSNQCMSDIVGAVHAWCAGTSAWVLVQNGGTWYVTVYILVTPAIFKLSREYKIMDFPRTNINSMKTETWTQLFDGRLALNPGLNLTLVSFSCVQKHFLG